MDNQQFQPVQNQSIWIIILPTIIITALIVGGGVWWWQKSVFEREKETLQQQIIQLQNQISELPQTVDDNQTADWQSYINKEYKYEVRYPKDWPINSTNSKEVVIGNISYEPSAGPMNIVIYQNKSFSFISEFKKNFPDGCSEEKETALGNLKTIKMTCIEAFAGQENVSYFIERNNNLYRLSYIKGLTELNKTSEQVIATFKFTN